MPIALPFNHLGIFPTEPLWNGNQDLRWNLTGQRVAPLFYNLYRVSANFTCYLTDGLVTGASDITGDGEIVIATEPQDRVTATGDNVPVVGTGFFSDHTSLLIPRRFEFNNTYRFIEDDPDELTDLSTWGLPVPSFIRETGLPTWYGSIYLTVDYLDELPDDRKYSDLQATIETDAGPLLLRLLAIEEAPGLYGSIGMEGSLEVEMFTYNSRI